MKPRTGQAPPPPSREQFGERYRQPFADPAHPISIEWRTTRERLLQAAARQRDPATPSRVLLVCGSPRNDGSCPGEMSKTFASPASPRRRCKPPASRPSCST